MGYIDAETIKKHQSLQELNYEYESREEDDDLPFWLTNLIKKQVKVKT